MATLDIDIGLGLDGHDLMHVLLVLVVLAPLVLLGRRICCVPKGRRRRMTVFMGVAYLLIASLYIALLWMVMRFAPGRSRAV